MRKASRMLGLGMGLVLLVPLSLWAKAAAAPATKTPKPAQAAGLDSLMSTYREESMEQAKYLAFAEKAQAEGYLKVAKLFQAAAMTEGLHAARHAQAIQSQGGELKTDVRKPKTGTTRQNLEAALAGMPASEEIPAPGKVKKPAASGQMPQTVDGNLKNLFSQALAELPAWKADGDFYVCQVCGNVAPKLNFQYCPICKVPISKYQKIQ